MPQMTAVQIRSPGGPFEVVKREIPAPGANEIRIRVQACGICHSDVFVKEGYWPGLHYPRVTGHEVAGVVDEVGAGVTAWKKGPAGGCGLAWRTLFSVRSLSAWRFHGLSELPSDWIPGGRRIRPLHDCETRSRGCGFQMA